MATGKVSVPFLYKAFEYDYSSVTNTIKNISQTNLEFEEPEGYTCVGVVTSSVGWTTGTGTSATTVFPVTMAPDIANMLQIRSISGTAKSGTARVVVVFARTGMVREV